LTPEAGWGDSINGPSFRRTSSAATRQSDATGLAELSVEIVCRSTTSTLALSQRQRIECSSKGDLTAEAPQCVTEFTDRLATTALTAIC